MVFLLDSPCAKGVTSVARILVNGTNVGPIVRGGSLNLHFNGGCQIYQPVVLDH